MLQKLLQFIVQQMFWLPVDQCQSLFEITQRERNGSGSIFLNFVLSNTNHTAFPVNKDEG